MSDEQKKPDAPAGGDMRETGVVNVMTSTSIHKHPTAFFNTRLPVLEVDGTGEVSAVHDRVVQALAGSGGW